MITQQVSHHLACAASGMLVPSTFLFIVTVTVLAVRLIGPRGLGLGFRETLNPRSGISQASSAEQPGRSVMHDMCSAEHCIAHSGLVAACGCRCVTSEALWASLMRRRALPATVPNALATACMLCFAPTGRTWWTHARFYEPHYTASPVLHDQDASGRMSFLWCLSERTK